MSGQLSLILCFPFMLIALLFGSDLVFIQSIYSSLDSLSTSISYKIGSNGVDKNGNVSNSINTFLKENMNAYLVKLENKTTYYEGDFYPYLLVKKYKPLILSSKEIEIKVKRYAIIGINHS